MASNPLKAEVRPISRDDGGQTKFHALECYPELRAKVAQGVPIPEVARWLQEDKKQYTVVTRESLTRMLYRFKQKIPPAERQQISPRAAQELLDKQREQIEFKVQPIRELEKLYKLQMERLAIDTAHEKDIGKLFGSTSNEMRLAMDMLVKLQTLQADVRGEQGGPKIGEDYQQISMTLAMHGSRPGVQKVVESAESRRKVLGIARTMVSFLGSGGDRAALIQTLLQTGETAAENAVSSMESHGGGIIDSEPEDVDENGVPFPPEGSVAE
jgi:hypothetical protein